MPDILHAEPPSVNISILAIRSKKTLEWDAPNMKVKNAPEFDPWIKEPVQRRLGVLRRPLESLTSKE